MGSMVPMSVADDSAGARLTSAGAFDWRRQRLAGSLDGLLQVAFVHLDADEAHAQLGAGNRGRAETEERVGDGPRALEPMQAQAHLGQLRRERRRVRPILLAALDGLVGDKPGIAATPDA